ncbi:MAG: peptidoglycan editing factor PgeF [Bacillota bacterium]
MNDYRGVQLFQTALLDFPWLQHGFSTRLGGVSEGVYATLNLGFRVGDLPERVAVNRKRLAEALGYDPERAVAGQQVHGDEVVPVTAREAGAGALEQGTALPATDGLVTSTPGLALLAFFADCVPVVLADTRRRAVGVAHAGWRGTLKLIAGKALARMSMVFNANPAECVAVLGPAIGPCCYTVGGQVAEAFAHWGDRVVRRDGGVWRVDLWEANRRILVAAGVPDGNIGVVRVCTACHPELMFSHRRNGGKTGRMAAVAAIRPKEL